MKKNSWPFTFPTAWWGMTGVGKSNFKEHGRSVLAKGISPGLLPEAGIGHGEPKQVKVSGAKTPATPRCGVVLKMKVVYRILPQHQPFRPLYTLLYGLKSSDSCSFLSSYRKDWIFFLFCRVHKPPRGNPSPLVAKEQEFGCGYFCKGGHPKPMKTTRNHRWRESCDDKELPIS